MGWGRIGWGRVGWGGVGVVGEVGGGGGGVNRASWGCGHSNWGS